MAIGLGTGEANIPLARTIIGGVIGATTLTLLVLPCLYILMKPPPPLLQYAEEAAPPRSIRIVARKPTVGTTPRRLILSGTLKAWETAPIYACVTGYLDEVSVDIGDHLARLTHRRLKHLLEESSEAVPKQDVDVAAAKAQMQAAQVSIALAKQEQSHTLNSFAKLQAPFNGFITKRILDPGA